MAKKGVRYGLDFVNAQAEKRRKWKQAGVRAGHGGDFDLGFADIGTKDAKKYKSEVVEQAPSFMVNPKLIDTSGLPDWLVFIVNNDTVVARGAVDKKYKASSPYKRRLTQAVRTKEMKSIDREHWLQVRICYELERQYPQYMGYWKAVPNGGHRSGTSAGRMQYEGQKTGAQDLDFDLPKGIYHGMKLEVKTDTGTPSKDQIEARDRFSSVGYYCLIEKEFEACWTAIVRYFALPDFDNKTKITS